MSETKWTPRPWRVDKTQDRHNYLQKPILGGERADIVCFVVGTTNPMIDWYASARDYSDNAHLIAAAPELYEALEKMVEDDFKSGAPDHYQRTASARYAIAKARGKHS